MKEFTYNLSIVCTFAAILALAGFSTGCTWTTYRPTDPHTAARNSEVWNKAAVGKTAKSYDQVVEASLRHNGVEQDKVYFVPVVMGRDAYGLRLFRLPEGHELTKRGYIEGEILASYNGEAFSPDKQEILLRVVAGLLEGAHLTVLRDGREVTLEPTTS